LNGLTANLKDHNIIAALDRSRNSTVFAIHQLTEEIKKQSTPIKRGGYN